MPDLLIVSQDPKQVMALSSKANDLGFRVRQVSTIQDASGWARNKPLDAACLSIEHSPAEVGRFANELWAHSPRAELFVFPAHGKNIYELAHGLRLEFAMLGASVVDLTELPHRIETLKRSLGTSQQRKSEVLVVEDLESPRDIICSFIEHLGVSKVSGVSSAQEALEQLEQDPDRFFCIVSDINMPKISGHELISRIRNHKKLQHLPVIALTAHGTADNLIQCLKAGASGFLVKPPSKQDLQRELARALRITLSRDNPRLAHENEVEQLRGMLAKKGLL